MTTQNDKPDKSPEVAKTQLRPSTSQWLLKAKASQDRIFPIHGEMLIGREGCDITLTSNHSSRKHAKLLIAEGVLRVEDLGSSNGTFVNDERVESSDLKPGDEVRFDTEIFIVEGPEQKAAETPADDNRTMLRPAAPEKEPAAEKKPAPKGDKKPKSGKAEQKKPEESEAEGKKAQEKKPEPDKQSEAPQEAAEAEPEEEKRGAWYERETPNMTRKVDAGDLRNQFQEGATQIVRGVQKVEMPSLIGTSGDWAGHVISLEKDATTIGRAGTDIILDEPSVSTKHAQIVRDGERWKVVDLMSANGVYVNGKKSQVSFLSPGDAVRFGRLEMRFVTDTTQVASRAAPAAGKEDLITGSGGASSKGGMWLYVAIGFIVVVAVGVYLLLSS